MKALVSFVLAFMLLAVPLHAESARIEAALDRHILPRAQLLHETAGGLNDTASRTCRPDDPDLRAAFGVAFDAWISFSHLRFGPTEADERAFALAFWPDSRGATPKALAGLINTQDPVVDTAAGFATVSIAARGFYALEYLLFDPNLAQIGAETYRCALIRAITRDIESNATAIHSDWAQSYAARMRGAGENDTYRSVAEAERQLFTALTTGLQFTSDTRLGRPLGTFDRPRPKRAEAWRSGRSVRHVILSLRATRDLAALLSGGDGEIDAAFERALQRADTLDDPTLGGVVQAQGRLKVEILQQNIDAVRALLATRLGPLLGVSAGFNALDGD